ncbi:hypothetical protein HMN09_00348300 [Mycena chlorophos]|uniref:Uncharacterized protein n=1 Tax=Mycena chlorophos TaxID=658473 RepID=A0A8H6WIQ4_MYCCL|nr:hypothetical protein HMN09_00348300 [Mycena chlorophos]
MFLTRFFNAPLIEDVQLRRNPLAKKQHFDLPAGKVRPFIDKEQGTYARVSFMGRVMGYSTSKNETCIAIAEAYDEKLGADFVLFTHTLARLQAIDETREPAAHDKRLWVDPPVISSSNIVENNGLIFVFVTSTTYIREHSWRGWVTPRWIEEVKDGKKKIMVPGKKIQVGETVFCTAIMTRIEEGTCASGGGGRTPAVDQDPISRAILADLSIRARLSLAPGGTSMKPSTTRVLDCRIFVVPGLQSSTSPESRLLSCLTDSLDLVAAYNKPKSVVGGKGSTDIVV